MKERKKLSLAAQIFIGLGLGIIAGLLFMAAGNAGLALNAEWAGKYIKPFGTIFLNLIKFIVVPIVLTSIIAGVISMRDIRKVGSIGWKKIVYGYAGEYFPVECDSASGGCHNASGYRHRVAVWFRHHSRGRKGNAFGGCYHQSV